MAVKTTLSNTGLSIKYKDGVDQSGKDIIKAKKFSNVKITSASQDLFDVADALSPLLKYEVTGITRSDESIITTA